MWEVDGATPGQVVLDDIKKGAESEPERMSVNNITQWALLQFLPSGFCLEFLPSFPQ